MSVEYGLLNKTGHETQKYLVPGGMSCLISYFYFSPVVGFKIKVPLFRIFLS